MAYFNIDDNTVLYYEEFGSRDNPTIVFVNGIVFTTASWHYQKKYLSEKYHVICYDMRCQGNSSREKQPFDYSLHVEDLNFLIEFLQLENPTIAGISYGSFVAKQFAVTFPDKLQKLILLTPLRNVDITTRIIYDSWVKFLKHNMMKEFYDLTLLVSYKNFRENITEKSYQKGLAAFKEQFDSKSIEYLITSFEEDEVFLNYAEIKTATLLIAAVNDLLHNPDHADAIAAEINNSQVAKINGGHAINIENYTDVNAAIVAFIES